MMKEDKQASRKGRQTIITSISISQEFRDYMDMFKISPTEALKKGISIELFERNIPQYKTQLNKERYNNLKQIEKSEKIKQILDNLEEMDKRIKEIKEFYEDL